MNISAYAEPSLEVLVPQDGAQIFLPDAGFEWRNRGRT